MMEPTLRYRFRSTSASSKCSRWYQDKAFDYKSAEELIWIAGILSTSKRTAWARNVSAEALPGLLNHYYKPTLLEDVLKIALKIGTFEVPRLNDLLDLPWMSLKLEADGLESKARMEIRDVKQLRKRWNLKKVLNILLSRCVISHQFASNDEVLQNKKTLYKYVLYKWKSEDSMQQFYVSMLRYFFEKEFDHKQRERFQCSIWRLLQRLD